MKIPPPVIVFVRPQAPGNLGALARVMSNFGCAELRYTGGFPTKTESELKGFSTMDWAMARKGEQILHEAKCYPDLNAALEGTQLAIGSSGRDREFERGYGRPHQGPTEALGTVAEWSRKAGGEDFRWAFVLGPEDDGLNEQESALCQKLVRLSTVDVAPSMNIAMAAGCFLYHWHLVNLGEVHLTGKLDPGPFPFAESVKRALPQESRADWADHSQKERFVDYVMETMGRTQFLKYPDREGIRARLRRWVQVAPIPLNELLYAFEMVYHLRAWASGKFESRDFLNKPTK